jgi:hypothetical protein
MTIFKNLFTWHNLVVVSQNTPLEKVKADVSKSPCEKACFAFFAPKY